MKKITITYIIFIITTITLFAQFDATLYQTLSDHKDWVTNVSFSPNGKLFVSASNDKTIKIYQITNTDFQLIKTIENHTDYVTCISFSKNGKFLATGSFDKSVIIYKIIDTSFQIIKKLKDHNGAIRSIDFSSDGKFLATGSSDNNVNIYKITNEKFYLFKTIKEHNNIVWDISFSPDSKFLASCSGYTGNGGSVKIHQIINTNFQLIKTLTNHNYEIQSVAFSHDSKTFATGSENNLINIYKIIDTNFQLIKTLTDHKSNVRSINFSPEGDFLASGSYDKTVKIYQNNSTGFNLIKTLSDHNSSVRNISFSPNGLFLATSSSDTTVNIYKLKGIKVGAIFDNLPPEIKIISPNLQNTRAFKPVNNTINQITIKGKAIDKSGVCKVLVNDKDANLSHNGIFSAQINLLPGENTIIVKATDIHNNTVTEQYTIERQDYQPPENNNIEGVGKYYALIIGVSNYTDPKIPDLNNEPTKDAKELQNILIQNYTFEKQNVKLLLNPTRKQIIRAFNEFEKIITEQDNFLIFYAGHGAYDKNNQIGYWIPSDAELGYTDGFLYNSTLANEIKKVHSKHTLLIADACFSGSIFKSRSLPQNADIAYQKKYELKSRNAITSGTLKTVPNESVFFNYLIDRLKDNTQEYMSASELFQKIEVPVGNNSPNTPQFGNIQNVGDEGGDFIFIRRD